MSTCRYTVGREDELTGQWIYGYRCGKPSVPGLAPSSPEYKAGACLEHLDGRHSPWVELRRIFLSRWRSVSEPWQSSHRSTEAPLKGDEHLGLSA